MSDLRQKIRKTPALIGALYSVMLFIVDLVHVLLVSWGWLRGPFALDSFRVFSDIFGGFMMAGLIWLFELIWPDTKPKDANKQV